MSSKLTFLAKIPICMRSSILLVIIFISYTSCFSQVDSLINELKITNDTSCVLKLFEIAKLLNAENSTDSAEHYFLLADSIAQKTNFTNGKVKIWRNLGDHYARKGDISKSLKWLDKGLALIEEENLPIINRVDYLINKGVTHYYNEDIAQALVPYIEATQICRENGFDSKRSMLLNNTGIFYRILNRYEESTAIYLESYQLRSKLKDTTGMANNLHNLSTVYSHLGDHQKAIQCIKDARVLFSKINSEEDLILLNFAEATSLYELGRVKEAFIKINKLKNIDPLPFNMEQQNNYNILLAKLHMSQGNATAVLQHLEKIEENVENSEHNQFKVDIYELKAKAFQSQQKYKLANNFLNKYIEAVSEKNQLQNIKVLKEMETKYLSVEKDNKIALLDSKNSLHEAQLQGSRLRNYFLLFGLISFGLLSFLMLYLYNKIKSKNEIISKSNSENETLLKEIHHRVKNNLQVISALLSLQSKYINDSNALEAINEGRNRVESMALIHKDLYQHDNLKGVNTQFYLEQLIETLFNSYKIQGEEVKLDLNIDSIWLDVDTMIPLGLMINELLSNAIKHAFLDQDNGVLSISLTDKIDHIELVVKDNGSGVEDVSAMKQKSFGYSLIQSFAKKLDAKIEYETDHGLTIKLIISDYKRVA